MEAFYTRLMAPAAQADALLLSLARLMHLDRDQLQQISSRFTWNTW